jgi:hypothetical protein
LDFATFTIEGPSTSTSTDAINAVAPLANDNYGRCVTDTFTVSSSAGAVPVICGTNTGQHIYVDSDGEQCSSASFTFGGTTATRQYNIKILQYDCRNEMGGPSGCLQFFTNDMGTFSSFNYVTPATPEADDTAHLANQNYNICIRKNNGKCRICYVPSIVGAIAGTNPSSFGLSIGMTAMKGDVGTMCTTDFLEILGLASEADSVIAITAATAAARTLNQGKICGMAFDAAGSTAAIANTPVSVCTSTLPFNVRFVSDDSELGTEIDAANQPTGRTGFSLTYRQLDC